MDIREAQRMYVNDPLFKTLVDAMVQGMKDLKFTAGDLREACHFASYRLEAYMTRVEKEEQYNTLKKVAP